jgi:hypothetical protein
MGLPTFLYLFLLIQISNQKPSHHGTVARYSYPCNRQWRPIGLWDVEAPTFSRQSAHRWRWGCQPYVPAALYSLGRFLVRISFRSWVDTRAIMRLERLGQLKKIDDIIGNRTRDLPACSTVPRPNTLPRAPLSHHISYEWWLSHPEGTRTLLHAIKVTLPLIYVTLR